MKKSNQIERLDFVDQMVKKYNYTKKSAIEAVDDILDLLIENMQDGNEVCFRGFGRFCLIQRKGRLGVNPQTFDRKFVPPHWVVKFYPGKTLKYAVRKWLVKHGPFDDQEICDDTIDELDDGET